MPIVKASLIAVICLCGAIAAVTVLSIIQPAAPEPFTPPSSTPLGKFRTAAVAADGEPCSQIGRFDFLVFFILLFPHYTYACTIKFLNKIENQVKLKCYTLTFISSRAFRYLAKITDIQNSKFHKT